MTYTLQDVIGRGTHGTVYKAIKDGKEYAIKCHKDGIYDASEACILFSFRHPALLRGIDAYWEDDELHTVTTLGKVINQCTLTLSEKIRAFYHVLTALQYLHSQCIIHGDVKPANIIMIDGIAQLGDFGLSQYDCGQTKSRKCTPTFQAPEIPPKGRDCVNFSNAIDMYAFGSTVSQMLTREQWCYFHSGLLSPSMGHRDDLLELVQGCCTTDPIERWSAVRALQSPLFAKLCDTDPMIGSSEGTFRTKTDSIVTSRKNYI